MAEAFVELGAEGLNHFTENHFENTYDRVRGRKNRGNSGKKQSDGGKKENRDYKYQLPSPERDRDIDGTTVREDSLERQSQSSERLLKAYENEPDDPRRPVDPKLEKRRRDSARMSYANGGYTPSQAPGRPRSQPPRGRYDDEDSDYDEHEGRRQRTSGRGYDDRDDREYDREVIETERYKGPARPYDPRRLDSYQSRGTGDPYGAGAVAPYRRSQNDVSEVSRRPKSRSGRSDRYDRDDDRDRSYSRSRSRSRDRGGEDGWRGKLDEHFDTTLQGLGVGIAGAVVGGLAGREFGKKHKNRDILIGALVGGLGANVAENKWQERREKKGGREEDRYEQKYDGRSRSNVR
ncbi:hypothetical protein LTR36_009812 [Oleoguttula mirabilis]|uniref:Glycine zipper 2TM domain-containing protein n=1 Tax=Oleoguttula mirabilis TaxID=1507867 RepID=A0AAV9J5N4_9PEZI|nr:hypothetical protein LTR36_009812 [Oleoguttula mirabilis]